MKQIPGRLCGCREKLRGWALENVKNCLKMPPFAPFGCVCGGGLPDAFNPLGVVKNRRFSPLSTLWTYLSPSVAVCCPEHAVPGHGNGLQPTDSLIAINDDEHDCVEV